MPTRPAGLRGRLPAREGALKFPVRWAHEYLTDPLPAPTYPIDVTEGIADFGMMGNDEWGNCGPVGEVHLEMTTAAAAKVTAPPPTSPLGVQRYQAYTGAAQPPGPGVDLAGYLLWLYRQQLIDGFGILDATDRATCDAFMAAGFGLYGGYQLSDNFEAAFGADKTCDAGAPNPQDGHCMVQVQASGSTPTSIDGHVTWGGLAHTTQRWTGRCRDEVFFVITTEEQKALFAPELFADLDAIPHHVGPADPTPKEPAVPASPSLFTRAWAIATGEHVAAVAFVAFATAEVGHLATGFSFTALEAAAVTGLGAGLGAAESIIAGMIVPGASTIREARTLRATGA